MSFFVGSCCMIWPWTNTAGASKTKGRVPQICSKLWATRRSSKWWISSYVLRSRQLHGSSCVVRSGQDYRKPISLRASQEREMVEGVCVFFSHGVITQWALYSTYLVWNISSSSGSMSFFFGGCCVTWPWTNTAGASTTKGGVLQMCSELWAARRSSKWRISVNVIRFRQPRGTAFPAELGRSCGAHGASLRRKRRGFVVVATPWIEGWQKGWNTDMIRLEGERTLEWFGFIGLSDVFWCFLNDDQENICI